jgi:hypothetical protein
MGIWSRREKGEKSMKKKGFGNYEDWKEEREKSKVSWDEIPWWKMTYAGVLERGRWNRRGEAFGLSGCATEGDKKRQSFLQGK